MPITSLGVGSGLDLETLVLQLVAAEGTPKAVRLDQQEGQFLSELSAFGSFRSAMDAFSSVLESLQDLESFSQRTFTSSNEELFTASGLVGTTTSNYDIEVSQLATNHKLRSAAYVDPDPDDPDTDASDAVVGTGLLTITVNGESMTLNVQAPDPLDEDAEPTNTLAALRDAINASADNPGVQASIVTGEDGAHLVLSSVETGETSEIKVSTTLAAGGLDSLVYDAVGGTTNLEQIQDAVDAEIFVDGVLARSSSNTITDVIEGVTINLLSADPGNPGRLDVTLDKDSTRQTIRNFVNTYNTLVDTVGLLTAYDAETQVAGPLQGDSLVQLAGEQLRRVIGDVVQGTEGGLSLLSEIGITTDFTNGKLEIDDAVLDEALDQNFDAIGELFTSDDGYAVRLDSIVQQYVESDGFIDTRVDGLNTSITDVQGQRDDLDQYLFDFEARLREEFVALDLLVAQLSATSDFLTAQLALLPTPGGSSS